MCRHSRPGSTYLLPEQGLQPAVPQLGRQAGVLLQYAAAAYSFQIWYLVHTRRQWWVGSMERVVRSRLARKSDYKLNP